MHDYTADVFTGAGQCVHLVEHACGSNLERIYFETSYELTGYDVVGYNSIGTCMECTGQVFASVIRSPGERKSESVAGVLYWMSLLQYL